MQIHPVLQPTFNFGGGIARFKGLAANLEPLQPFSELPMPEKVHVLQHERVFFLHRDETLMHAERRSRGFERIPDGYDDHPIDFFADLLEEVQPGDVVVVF